MQSFTADAYRSSCAASDPRAAASALSPQIGGSLPCFGSAVAAPPSLPPPVLRRSLAERGASSGKAALDRASTSLRLRCSDSNLKSARVGGVRVMYLSS